ncbi:MAG: hypothetical protein JG777_178 [Clostridia bacterium]|nr:hypothetical protein [Clostridia bacterium]
MNLLKRMMMFVVMLVVFSVFITISAFAEEVAYGVVTGSCVNIREQPNTSCKVLGQLYRGEKVKVLGRSDEWIKISYNDNVEGWMHGAYISIRNPEVSRSGGQVDRGTSGSLAADIIGFSKKFLGVPYKYGGTSPKGFDCSGFTQYVFKHFGININRVAHDQSEHGKKVDKKDLAPGDLVFFGNVKTGYIDHVGIYVGDNQFIHASSPGSDVKYDSLNEGYYQRKYITARRIIPEQ